MSPFEVTCLMKVIQHQKVSGYFTPGTFQQYVLGPASYVTPIPDTLASADAAPMLCAGLTVYSALRKSLAKSGQWVVISGAGGGLGHMACQIASRGMAFRVLGIDHGSKESFVRECGAEEFLDVAKFDDGSLKNEVRRITGGRGASAAIVCAASNRSYAQALSFLKFHGTLVCVGMPEGRNEAIGGAFPSQMVLDEIRIVGSAVGGRREALEVLELAARGVVKTHYRLEKMENLNDVFQEMAEGKLQGRVVLDLA
jgi:propanol-preferring alcohol dehydrogenase